MWQQYDMAVEIVRIYLDEHGFSRTVRKDFRRSVDFWARLSIPKMFPLRISSNGMMGNRKLNNAVALPPDRTVKVRTG